MYAEQEASGGVHHPLAVPDGRGFVLTTAARDGESAFLLRRGLYVNVDVVRQGGVLPPDPAPRLVAVLGPRLR